MSTSGRAQRPPVSQSYRDGSLAAVPGDGVGHGRCCDGLDEGGLSVVVPLLPPRPEGRHGAVPDLRAELGSALLDSQLCSGSHAGCEGNIGLEREILLSGQLSVVNNHNDKINQHCVAGPHNGQIFVINCAKIFHSDFVGIWSLLTCDGTRMQNVTGFFNVRKVLIYENYENMFLLIK